MISLRKILKEALSPSTAMWNGYKVELGKIYSNPMYRAFEKVEVSSKPKKLRVFDFDDTLVTTNSNIYVIPKNGKKFKLTPGQFAVYKPKAGDKFDFKDFEKVKNPVEIRQFTKLLKKISQSAGSRGLYVLTARHRFMPVKNYLKDIGISNIYVVALASGDPNKKAEWIEDKIKSGYNDIFFIDDSPKNIQAVSGLKNKYPNIKIKVQYVDHNKLS